MNLAYFLTEAKAAKERLEAEQLRAVAAAAQAEAEEIYSFGDIASKLRLFCYLGIWPELLFGHNILTYLNYTSGGSSSGQGAP